MDKWQLYERLARRGYEKLGVGAYSSVWAKPDSSKVIKVGETSDSWLRYIVWAMAKGYVGNHAPRVESFKVNDCYFIAVMERLYSLNSEGRQLVFAISDGSTFNDTVPCEWQTFKSEFNAAFPEPHDMHRGNWMQRKNGELVLTDPVHRGGQSTERRYKSKPRISTNSPGLVWC